jgi:Putative amidase domain
MKRALSCEGEDQEMPAFYNRLLAAGYASTYASHDHYNKAYIADTDDCTNFVSQALYSGGWPMTGGAGDNDDTAWYNVGDPDSLLGNRWGRSSFKRSSTWAAASNFSRFLQISGRARRCNIDELVIGDVVQHFVNGRPHHTMMITAVAPSTPSTPATPGLNGIVLLASYHTKDKLNVPLTVLDPAYGDNWFWKVFDHVPDTNSGRDVMLRGSFGKNWSH